VQNAGIIFLFHGKKTPFHCRLTNQFSSFFLLCFLLMYSKSISGAFTPILEPPKILLILGVPLFVSKNFPLDVVE
jgi:hypothetical protein